MGPGEIHMTGFPQAGQVNLDLRRIAWLSAKMSYPLKSRSSTRRARWVS